jgi:DNA-binding response OmpR family regulator
MLIIVEVRILLVEDNTDLSSLLKDSLSDLYVLDVAETLLEASRRLDLENYDLIILDLFLPDGYGLDFCKRVRKDGSQVPILFLTTDASTEAKVTSLNSGGDDYLTKPFHLEELKARIEVLLRRSKRFSNDVLTFKDFEVDYYSGEISKNNEVLALTRKEFILFNLFLKNPKKIFSKEQIASSVWEDEDVLFSNTIEAHIASLRRKIDRQVIKTVRGRGYRLGDST